MSEERELSSNLQTLSSTERERHQELSKTVREARAKMQELQDGYEFRLQSEMISLLDLAEWIPATRRCCPFLEFEGVGLLGSDERLTYFTSAWDGKIYELASVSSRLVVNVKAGAKSTMPAALDTPYQLRGYVLIKGQLWRNVEILDEVCGEAEPRVLYAG